MSAAIWEKIKIRFIPYTIPKNESPVDPRSKCKKKWNHKSTRRKSGKILLWAGCREMAFLTMMQSPDLIKEGIDKFDYIKKKQPSHGIEFHK